MKYKTALADWQYLFEGIECASDMTGGYVDSEDLELLLKNPTKKQAMKCLCDQIAYWFSAGIDDNAEHGHKTFDEICIEYPGVKTIMKRHGIIYHW